MAVVQAGTFHSECVKTITVTYALIPFFNIISGVRCMKISRKKVIGQNWRAMVHTGIPHLNCNVNIHQLILYDQWFPNVYIMLPSIISLLRLPVSIGALP